jgi:hypothetical protein
MSQPAASRTTGQQVHILIHSKQAQAPALARAWWLTCMHLCQTPHLELALAGGDPSLQPWTQEDLMSMGPAVESTCNMTFTAAHEICELKQDVRAVL